MPNPLFDPYKNVRFDADFDLGLVKTDTGPDNRMDFGFSDFNARTVIGEISYNTLNTTVATIKKSMRTFNKDSWFSCPDQWSFP